MDTRPFPLPKFLIGRETLEGALWLVRTRGPLLLVLEEENGRFAVWPPLEKSVEGRVHKTIKALAEYGGLVLPSSWSCESLKTTPPPHLFVQDARRGFEGLMRLTFPKAVFLTEGGGINGVRWLEDDEADPIEIPFYEEEALRWYRENFQS